MVTKFRRQPTTEATKCVSAGYEDRLHYLPKPVAEVDIESPGSIRGFLFALRSTKRRLDALVSSDWWTNCVGFLAFSPDPPEHFATLLFLALSSAAFGTF